MIGITTQDGELHILVIMKIRNAPRGQWSPERQAKLANLITNYIATAEEVDAAEGAEVANGRNQHPCPERRRGL